MRTGEDAQRVFAHLLVDERADGNSHPHSIAKHVQGIDVETDGRYDGAETDAHGVQVSLPQFNAGAGGEKPYQAPEKNRLDDSQCLL